MTVAVPHQNSSLSIQLSTVFVSFFVGKISLRVIVTDSVSKFVGWL